MMCTRTRSRVVDWFSRRVLAWRLSITMEVEFCLDAVDEALTKYGRPKIFNTDQGSQFTSTAFTGLLLENAIAISMDGRGSWRDNVFVERLWRSVKYEEVYLHAYDSVGQARASLGRYLDFYNCKRPHSSLAARTPDRAGKNHFSKIAQGFLRLHAHEHRKLASEPAQVVQAFVDVEPHFASQPRTHQSLPQVEQRAFEVLRAPMVRQQALFTAEE
jgi:putative transposase